MKTFEVEIRKELTRIVLIEAENARDAITRTRDLCQNKEIVLGTADSIGRTNIYLHSSKDANLDQSAAHHLRQIIDYLCKDEEMDYEQSGYPADHIYHSIVAIRRWMEINGRMSACK